MICCGGQHSSMQSVLHVTYRERSLADKDQRAIDNIDALGGSLQGLRLCRQRVDVADDFLSREC